MGRQEGNHVELLVTSCVAGMRNIRIYRLAT